MKKIAILMTAMLMTSAAFAATQTATTPAQVTTPVSPDVAKATAKEVKVENEQTANVAKEVAKADGKIAKAQSKEVKVEAKATK